MKNKEEHGGSAFPGPFTGHCGDDDHVAPCACYVDPGMTLRDYFAAKALPSIQRGSLELAKLGNELTHDHQALAAYRMADAMLRARSVG